MSRPKKDRSLAKGIHRKGNKLYIVIYRTVTVNGIKKDKSEWIATGLDDNEENVNKALQMREKMLNEKKDTSMTIPRDHKVTVSDLVDIFLEQKEREIADTTYSTYYYRGKRIKEYFGTTPLISVSKSDVEAFLDSLFENKNLSSGVVKDTKRVFNQIMDIAEEKGLIPFNPVTKAKIKKELSKKHKKKKDTDAIFLSLHEINTLFRSIEDHPLYEFYFLAVKVGFRREELLGLKWSAINMKKKRMIMNNTVTKGFHGVNRDGDGKTESSIREQPLSDDLVYMFKKLREKEDYYRNDFGDSYNDNDFVFKHPDGSLFYPDYPSKEFRRIVKSLPDLPQGLTLHGLRKSCASLLASNGVELKAVQNWLGHSEGSNVTTEVYTLVKNDQAKTAVSAELERLIKLKDYDD